MQLPSLKAIILALKKFFLLPPEGTTWDDPEPQVPAEPVAPPPPPPPPKKSAAEILFDAAVNYLGVDASPNDVAPDEFGCAESVWEILVKAFPGEFSPKPTIVSTLVLKGIFDKHPRLKKVTIGERGMGTIILCATTEGTTGRILNGHVGIIGKPTPDGGDWYIMSNDSVTGKFMRNFTGSKWWLRWVKEGGYPVHYYKPID